MSKAKKTTFENVMLVKRGMSMSMVMKPTSKEALDASSYYASDVEPMDLSKLSIRELCMLELMKEGGDQAESYGLSDDAIQRKLAYGRKRSDREAALADCFFEGTVTFE
jgi:hypothetical protein